MAKLEIQLGADSAELLKGLADSERDIREWVNRVGKMTPKINLKAFEKELLDLRNALAAQKLATEAARTSTNEFRASQAQAGVEAAKYKTQQAAAAAELAKLRVENAKAKASIDVASGSYREAQLRLTALGKEIRNAKDGFTATTPAIRAQIAEYLKLNERLKAFDKQMGNHQREVGNYGLALAGLSPIFRTLDVALGAVGASLTGLVAGSVGVAALGTAFKSLAAGALAFIATPLGATLLTLGTAFALFQGNKDTVIQFDAGLKNVSKTSGLAGKQLQGLSDELINTSRKLRVVGTDKLLEYATVAGQLGVKGARDIENFSASLSKLEIASNLKGEEGATQVARFLTLVDGGVQNVSAFGDELVNLGNNFAASEKEIIGNAEAISQNVGLYRIGRQDVLAYAVATKALGLEAEVVGSTFNRTLAEFEKTIRTGKGVGDVLKIIGGTAGELSERFKSDASGVFQDYIKGLNNIYQSGGSVNEALERTGIIAVRDQRVIATLASSGFDTLAKSMNDVQNATGAMGKEFDTASGKLENAAKRIGIAWDNIVLSIENGEGVIGRATKSVLTLVADALEGLNRLGDKLSELKSERFTYAIEVYQKTGKTGVATISVEEVEEEIRRRDQVQKKGIAQSKANLLLAGKDELQIRKYLANERKKLADAQSRLDTRLAALSNPKNKISDFNVAKEGVDRLRSQLASQRELVSAIEETYKSLPKTAPKTSDSIFDKKEETEVEKRAKKIAEVWKKLSDELKITNADIQSSIDTGVIGSPNQGLFDKAKEDLKSYQKAWEDLIKLGFKEGSKELATLTEQILLLKRVTASGDLLPAFSTAIPSAKIPKFKQPEISFTAPKELTDEQKFIQRSIRTAITNVVNESISALSQIGEKNLEIENKYSELRRDATTEQIALYDQMEKLEKSVSTGLLSTLNSVFGSLNKGINDIFIKSFSDSLSKIVSEGEFKLGGLTADTSKALIAGASIAGGILSGMTSKTSALGQGAGGAISGAGTGAALGVALGAKAGPWGAIAGALLGGLAGIFGAGRAKKQEELQKQQVELQKRQLEEQKRANALAYTSAITGQMTNQGLVTGVDRNAFGDIVFRIEGQDLVASLKRAEEADKRGR